jgi:outer membrane protein TolC
MPPPRRHPALLIVLLSLTPIGAAAEGASPQDGAKKKYDLAQLLQQVRRSYPGIRAAKFDLEAMEHKLFRAKWAWVPQGKLTGFVTFAPTIRCLDSYDLTTANRNETRCVHTSSALELGDLSIGGVWLNLQLQLAAPLYTFGKLSAAKAAATAGVEAKRAEIKKAEGDVYLQLVKAYWGVKLARELKYTIRVGRTHLDSAVTRLEKEIAKGEGDSTLADLLRLRTHVAEVNSRTIQANSGEVIALAGLATLTGLPENQLEIDSKIIDVTYTNLASLATYVGLAKRHRPEVKMINAGLVASRSNLDLELANFFPDIALVGSASVSYASSVDNPSHAFYSDPFNGLGAGILLGMEWKIEPIQQIGKYRTAKAEHARDRAKAAEALLGIEFEIKKIYLELKSAIDRLDSTRSGQLAARKWLVATSQNLGAGLAEPKELTDALVSYFLLRIEYLQGIYEVNVGWALLARAVGLSPLGIFPSTGTTAQ